MLTNGYPACSSRGFEALLLNIAPNPNRSTKAQNLHFCPYCYKPLLGDVVLSELEQKWLDRFKKYLSDYKYDYVCSWWLRCEYQHEKISTQKINYILSKVAKKGILKKETTTSYTKFSLNLA